MTSETPTPTVSYLFLRSNFQNAFDIWPLDNISTRAWTWFSHLASLFPKKWGTETDTLMEPDPSRIKNPRSKHRKFHQTYQIILNTIGWRDVDFGHVEPMIWSGGCVFFCWRIPIDFRKVVDSLGWHLQVLICSLNNNIATLYVYIYIYIHIHHMNHMLYTHDYMIYYCYIL